MTLHQERAAAVRRLVDQAREIEKSRRQPTATLEKIGGLLVDAGAAAPSSFRRTSSRSAPTAASIA